MDQLSITGLKINTIIGVYPHEKEIKQELLLDLTFYFDAQPSAKSDSLNDTIDYDQLTRELKKTLEQKNFHLIERVAEDTAHFCLSSPTINEVSVSVAKPSALDIAKNVTISIHRKQNE